MTIAVPTQCSKQGKNVAVSCLCAATRHMGEQI
jgi:hypothetical protein